MESRGIQLKVDIITGKTSYVKYKGKWIRSEQEQHHRGVGRFRETCWHLVSSYWPDKSHGVWCLGDHAHRTASA
jgi:hypothetical protein